VVIAAAGWAAHLPGVLAAYTTLPVIGVPIGSSPLGGLDALYSIVQMPPGVPVAAVGIDTARNAGLLAAQILALSDSQLAHRLAHLQQQTTQSVEEKAARLEQEGHRQASAD
jgi:5-(carboxyamino)imidazole ribonucleotide mutase